MYNIAVMGDRESVLGFAALGLTIVPTEDPVDARQKLRALASGNTAIVYITETLAEKMPEDIDKYKDALTPAIIVIPGKEGSTGMGMSALRAAVERAVGADILGT